MSVSPIDRFPGPATPPLAQLIDWGLHQDSYWNKLAARYGSPFRVRWPFFYEQRVVCFTTPSAARSVMRLQPEVAHGGEANRVLIPSAGVSAVIVVDEDEHLRLRKLILPPLHGKRLARWEGFVGEQMQAEVDTWTVGDTFALRPVIERIALAVIMKIVFGVRDPKRAQQMHDLSPVKQEVTVLQGLGAFTKYARVDLGPLSPWGRFQRTKKRFDDLLYAEIAERRAELDAGVDLGDRSDLLTMLLEARDDDGRPMTDQELRDQLSTMLLAGHETTATAIAWAVERLTRHPEVMRTLLGRLDAGDTTYLDAAIKETLRSRPVVAQLGRVTTEEVVIDGWTVPPRTMLIVPMAVIHQDPTLYPDPDVFRPERFLDGNDPGGYSWLPFGGGVRRCPGASLALLEMRVILSAILRSVELQPETLQDEGRKVHGITIWPAQGCRIRVAGRRRDSGQDLAA
jgi:cytochrome P450